MIHEAKARPQPLTVPELIARAEAMQLNDPDAAMNFTARLQREQYGWTRPYAERVTREYTRFLILAAVSDRQVTPSEAVDQAWHLHIVYTESYHEWCEALFGRYLHHGPTKGGQAEGERFEGQYEHTLALYERTFGEVAPRDIWPDAKERFARRNQGVWLQPARFWVIPRVFAKRAVAGTLVAGMLSVLGLAVSTGHPSLFLDTHAQRAETVDKSTTTEQDALTPAQVVLITLCGGIVLTGALFSVVGAARGKREGKDGGGGGCSSWFGCGSSGDGGSGCGGDSGCGSGCGGGGCGGGCGS